MRHLVAIHSVLLPAPASGGAAVPEWIQLIPAGEFRGRDGRGPWRLSNPEEVLTATQGELPLVIDETHATDYGAATGQEARARGWVDRVEIRDGSIWGRVEWTPTGTALMAEKAYRSISPVFAHLEDGTVLRVLRAALTNVPNLTQLAALNSQDPTHMDLLAQLRQLHGLAADADAAACLAACQADRTAVDRHGVSLNAIATAAGLTTGQDATAIASAIAASRAAAGDKDALAKEVTSLHSQLTELRNATAKKDATAFVDKAMAAGKPIAKVLRDHYISRHMADPAAVETEIGAMVSLNAGGIVNPPADGGGAPDPVQIAHQAQKLQDDELAAGRSISFAEAVQRVQAKA